MTNDHTEENLRKLAPVSRRDASLGWLLYLSGDTDERRETDELLDILLFQRIRKDYREQILLDPPAPADTVGEYPLGTVLYPPRVPFSSFGLRENEWIKHVMIAGMTGTGKTNLAFHLLRELRRHGNLCVSNSLSRRYRELGHSPTVGDPSDLVEFGASRGTSAGEPCWRVTPPAMRGFARHCSRP